MRIEEEHRLVPKVPQWSLASSKGTNYPWINCDDVYVYSYVSSNTAGDVTNLFSWIRLWPDGHASRRFLPYGGAFPGTNELCGLYGCDVGYFQCDGRSIIMEMYAPHYYYGSDGYYMYHRMYFEGDDLVSRKAWVRREPEPADRPRERWLIYKRVRAGPALVPNW